jgi:hypothetical protein
MKLSSFTNLKSGYSLFEANIAVAICIITLGGCFAANANCLGMLRAANESAAASQSLQERVEQMRIANWVQITDSNYLKTHLVASPTASARSLNDCTETLTLTAYPPPVGVSTSTKIRRTNGVVSVDSHGPNLKNSAMVKAEWTLSWKTAGKETLRTRTGAALVANGGIVK